MKSCLSLFEMDLCDLKHLRYINSIKDIAELLMKIKPKKQNLYYGKWHIYIYGNKAISAGREYTLASWFTRWVL